MKLDEWQQELADGAMNLIESLKPKEVRHVINAPTGGGKTEIGIEIIKQVFDYLDTPDNRMPNGKSGTSIGWLSERTILLNETADRLRAAGLKVRDRTKSPSDYRMLSPGVVNMLTPQTFVTRSTKGGPKYKHGHRPMAYEEPIGEWGVLIADEAHHAAADFYGSCVRAWGGPVVGLTATSWLLSAKIGLGEGTSAPQRDGRPRHSGPWKTIAYGPPPKDLVGQRLSGVEFPKISDQLKVREWVLAQTDMSADGYTPQSVDEEVARMLAIGKPIIDEWERLANRPTLWFCRSKSAANKLAEMFKEQGYTAGVVLSETPEAERRKLLDDLAAGRLMCLASVDVFGEGVNVPSVNCVGILRPTCSLTKHLQFLGRGLRIREDGSPLRVLDFADNVSRLGSPLQARNEKQFGLIPRDSRPTTGGFGGAVCPKCKHPCIWSQEHCHNPVCRAQLSWVCEGDTIKYIDPYEDDEEKKEVTLEVPGHQVREWQGRFGQHSRTACDRAIEEAIRAYHWSKREEREKELKIKRETEEAQRKAKAEQDRIERQLVEARARRRSQIVNKWRNRKAKMKLATDWMDTNEEANLTSSGIGWITDGLDCKIWAPLQAVPASGGNQQPRNMVVYVDHKGQFRIKVHGAPVSKTIAGLTVDISGSFDQIKDAARDKLFQWGLKRGQIISWRGTNKYGEVKTDILFSRLDTHV